MEHEYYISKYDSTENSQLKLQNKNIITNKIKNNQITHIKDNTNNNNEENKASNDNNASQTSETGIKTVIPQ